MTLKFGLVIYKDQMNRQFKAQVYQSNINGTDASCKRTPTTIILDSMQANTNLTQNENNI